LEESCNRDRTFTKERKFLKGSGAKSFMTYGFLMYDFIYSRISSYVRRPIYDFKIAPSRIF
jgi:hypothetical protein